jgi:hypothetical protein
MKLKKYNEFVNEELTPISSESELLETPEEIEAEEIEKTAPENISTPQEEEEEEGHQYHGTLKMKELADKLGTNVVNNEINFDGKKVNFFSEDEKFHIDNKKFDSVEDAFDYLTGE